MTLVETHPEVLDAPTLADLAETANREHRLAGESARVALTHVLRVGEALLTARQQVEASSGDWRGWVEENWDATYSSAEQYIRVYRHRESVPPDARNIVDALKAVVGLSAINGVPTKYPEHVRAEALTMLEEGKNQREVSLALGVSIPTIQSWLHPEKFQTRRQRERDRKRLERTRRERAERALLQQERDQAVRKIGGTVAESYSMLRKTAQRVDQAKEQAEGREARLALKAALTKLHAAEDDIVRALGIS